MNKHLNKNTLWDRLKNCLQLSSIVILLWQEMLKCLNAYSIL